ncbi:MAG: hypothetical protein GF364_08660 [Candidatus Lokiarchaeota archaeon]|nr:hypothetical protein [Candidatus Lokiarchaeota archaeon]
MIHALYIIDSGICIYSYRFKKDTDIDEQLLSGFLTAIGNFAKETFKSDTGLQTIQIQDEKLNFYLDKKNDLLYCAVSSYQDNNTLLESILKEISEAFSEQMREFLSKKQRASIHEYKEFNPILEKIMEDKEKERNKKTMLLGLFLGLLSVIGLIIVFSLLLGVLSTFISQELVLFVLLIFLTIGLWISSRVSGYYAGSPEMGLKNGIVFLVVLFVVLLVFLAELIVYFIYMIPFIAVVCAAGGYYGGLLRDRRKLYPLK